MPRSKRIDPLSPRERAFVEARRADPMAPNWKIAKAAGFKGDEKQLKRTAQMVMHRSRVSKAVFAPRSKKEELKAKAIDDMTDEEVGRAVRQAWLDIMQAPGATHSDKIRAATKLGETIRGLFVPIQIDTKQIVTMEDIVRGMGGAPPDEDHPVAGATQKGADA